MSPSPASAAALLLILAALGLIVLSATALPPRTVTGRDLELSPVEHGERPMQRSRRVTERQVTEGRTVPAPTPDPAAVVTAYYRALDARRFGTAWETLTPAVRTSFGSFEAWRAGYATTLASRPHGIAVQRDGTVATIAHELVTDDRSPCGPVRRSFAVRWGLVLATAGWRATSLSAVKRSGPEPAAACAAPS